MSKRELFLRFLGQTSDTPLMLNIEFASGIYLIDINGKKYIDLISGVSVSSLGHNNKKIVEAVKSQAEKYMHLMVYGEYIQAPQVKLAEKLCSILPESLNSVYYVNSGSEAIEGAIKLAKRYTRRHEIISFKNAYHGSTAGALSLCGNEGFKNSFRPLLPGITIAEVNKQESIDKISDKTACVIIEPIQAEAGIMIPSNEFMQSLRKKCDETGSLLIFDEIQTGFGRTGKMFAMEHSGVIPDITCFAKAFGGGMPLGAFVANKSVMQSFTSDPILGHITTFGGHPVSCAAALASLEIILNENLADNARCMAELFKSKLKHKAITEIRGYGLLMSVELGSFDKVQKFIQKGIENGLVSDWFIFHDTAFRIAPPLNISEAEVNEACSIILKILDELD
ncbi:MAG: aspartate aminotransferase family protein [Bacteroidales bacterium]|nr:aspartate aminotransferase family protein [Bacteroidales bacterium]